MQNIEPSSGLITRRGDTLSVQLIRPRIDRREVVLLVWPPNPTSVSPAMHKINTGKLIRRRCRGSCSFTSCRIEKAEC
jgi:hypothetical protein